jgi:hypothetical protein
LSIFSTFHCFYILSYHSAAVVFHWNFNLHCPDDEQSRVSFAYWSFERPFFIVLKKCPLLLSFAYVLFMPMTFFLLICRNSCIF